MGKTERIQFKGFDGDVLDARLESPAGKPKAFALFAHCFSCTKSSLAATHISRRLTEHGIAVLRFDFTGLGQSEGDFSNTNFSSNVQDILAAADWLKTECGSCDLLVGHSLGGAAVLVAASKIDQLKAVVTIGAPADADHILHTLSSDLDRIQECGKASVTLGGQAFTIKEQFVSDVQRAQVRDAAGALRLPLLFLHAPLDETVSIDNATDLFVAARHPKSFISLDKADHLLSRESDARYAADALAGWASAYLGDVAERASLPDIPRGEVLSSETGEGPYANHIVSGEHVLRSDEPASVGGLDTGLAPTEFLSAALAACTSITLRMYLNRKDWPADHIAVRVHMDRSSEKDATGFAPAVFRRDLSVTGPLSEDQRSRLVEIANKCPVHKILHAGSDIRTTISEVD